MNTAQYCTMLQNPPILFHSNQVRLSRTCSAATRKDRARTCPMPTTSPSCRSGPCCSCTTRTRYNGKHWGERAPHRRWPRKRQKTPYSSTLLTCQTSGLQQVSDIDDSSTSFFLVNSRTLMGCTPISVLSRFSVASCLQLIYADVRLHIPMTLS